MSDTKTCSTKKEAQEQAADLAYFADAIEHFDTHDMSEELASMPEVQFEINVKSRKAYIPLDLTVSQKLRGIAHRRGISAETLLNQWVEEKVEENTAEAVAVGEVK
jgi:hypothetical protein